MRKQIEVWEGKLEESKSKYTSGLTIDDDSLEDIVSSIESYEGKKIRITVEVIE